MTGSLYLGRSYSMDFLRYLQNSHPYHFSWDTLTRMAASQGIKRVIGDEIVRASFKAMTPAEAAAVKNYTQGDQTYQGGRGVSAPHRKMAQPAPRGTVQSPIGSKTGQEDVPQGGTAAQLSAC